MNRRELFKRMVAVPLFTALFNGRKSKATAFIDPTKKTVVFVDKNVIPPEMVAEIMKDSNPIIIPVDVPSGMGIDQVVRLFQG